MIPRTYPPPSDREGDIMGGSKRKHLDMDARKAIEDGIGDKLTAREIAKRIDVSQTTVMIFITTNILSV